VAVLDIFVFSGVAALCLADNNSGCFVVSDTVLILANSSVTVSK
jgi:hypothetical protein